MLIIRGSGSGKTNTLLNLINNQPDIDKIYLSTKGQYEAKHQYFIKNREDIGKRHFDNPEAFIEYSNVMRDIYKNTEEYKLRKKFYQFLMI